MKRQLVSNMPFGRRFTNARAFHRCKTVFSGNTSAFAPARKGGESIQGKIARCAKLINGVVTGSIP